MIVSGPVQDDEWNEHVMNGEAFVGLGFQTGVAGQIGNVQLFNPLGAFVPVRVRLRCLETIPIGGVGINTNPRRHDVGIVPGGSFAGPRNLLGSGGAGTATELRASTNVGHEPGGVPFWLILSAGSTRKDYPTRHLDWGHDLLPGQGILLTSAVGGFIKAGFMWVETPL